MLTKASGNKWKRATKTVNKSFMIILVPPYKLRRGFYHEQTEESDNIGKNRLYKK